MTLHWWMHWFWVTAQLAVILASPLPSTTQNPIIERIIDDSTGNLSIASRIERPTSINDQRKIINDSIIATSSSQTYYDEQRESRISPIVTSFRVPKAINSHDSTKKTNTALSNNNNPRLNEEISNVQSTTTRISSYTESSTNNPNRRKNVTRSRAITNSSMKKREDHEIDDNSGDSIVSDSEITWVITTSKTPERRKKKNDNFTSRPDIVKNFSIKSHEEEKKDLTVLPLRIESTRIKLVVNSTRTITADGIDGFSTRTFNGSEDIEIDQELAEPRLSATAASILQDFLTAGISESTRLSRARNAFTSDFQRDHREEDRASDIDVDQVIIEANESVNREIDTSSSPSVIDIAAITGSCLATIVLLSTMASLGFIMYRRKYLNPPQTLNSDKCSNPDSSGYIDDSTIRDNSEEMYSLDNDSFLNSLEAMTIQNYWTDSVKHTKL